jgi:Flp pilus assembly protein TadG
VTCDSFVRRFRRDESGQTLVLAAIMLPVLIGFVGFAVDVGYAFDYKKQMQLAADSAAMAGAFAVKANGSISSTDLATLVTMDTANNGFTNGSGGIAVNVCRPAVDLTCPTTYTYAAGDNAVKVSISQTRDTFFTKILSFNSMTIGASAVAAKSNGSGNTSNIVILDTACENALSITGGNTLTLAGSIYVNACGNSAATVSGGGAVNAAGGTFIGCNGSGQCGNYVASGGSTWSPTPTLTQPQIADPLASLPEPTLTGSETNWGDVTTSGTQTVQPGIYTELKIPGGTVTMAAGTYFINGGKFEVSGGAQVSGTGVFIYGYNNALFSIANNATVVTLSAPTSGTYRGILYFQQRSNSKDAVVSGGATVNLDGVIYISNPSSKLTFSGGSSSGALASYTVLVVWELVMGGGGTFGTDFAAIGGSPLAGGTAGLALSE